MTFCPFCGLRQDVNLRQIHFRDLGTDAALPCPECTTPLAVIEFDTEPKIRIERCGTCFGTFFNPGEMEALLDAQTNPLVWIDPVQLQQIAKDFGYTHRVVYRRCPMCAEHMSHLNFGGLSGVILDRCGAHGVWLEGSELRRLTEWWRAGGKHLHQQNEAVKAKAKRDQISPRGRLKRVPMTGTVESTELTKREKLETGASIAWMIGSIASLFLD